MADENNSLTRAQAVAALCSEDRDTVAAAVSVLWKNGWAHDGTLCNANLEYARLETFFMGGANLAGAYMRRVKLRNTSLMVSNLTNAIMWEAGVNLTESNCAGAVLSYANLTDALLTNANLSNATLPGASLERATLRQTNLTGAVLSRARLIDAALWYTNLRDACLNQANLTGAEIRYANFCGALMIEARLEGVIGIETARFDHATVLPDGSFWTPDTDMRRFVDPPHPDFFTPPEPDAG